MHLGREGNTEMFGKTIHRGKDTYEHPAYGKMLVSTELTPEFVVQMRDSLFAYMGKFPKEMTENMIWSQCDGKRATIMAMNLLTIRRDIELYIWEQNIADAARRGAEAFEDTPLTPQDVPVYPQLWFIQGQSTWNTID